MPGVLYQYVNLYKIRLNKTRYSTTKTLERPSLRDIEWERGYNYWVARGFSGFDADPEYHCEWRYLPIEKDGAWINPHPQKKRFMPPQEYIRRSFPAHYGKPSFRNPALNQMEFGGRESGKSMWLSNCIFFNFGTDGLFDYDRYLSEYPSNQSVTVVGGETIENTKDVLSKFLEGYEHLPGDYIDRNGVRQMSPIYRRTSGTFEPGKRAFQASYPKKDPQGRMRYVGSGSYIPAVTLFNNPTAANRHRANLVCIEEVGMVRQWLRFLGAVKDVVAHGTRQFGTVYAVGTAGKSKPEIVDQIEQVFYGPEAYNFLAFPNTYDQRSDYICFFVNAVETMNDMMDEEGHPKREEAWAWIESEIKRLSDPDTGSKQALHDFRRNRPTKPADCFLLEGGKQLEQPGMEEWLEYLKGNPDEAPMTGEMRGPEANFVRDLSGNKKEASFPVQDGGEPGAVCVWEPPLPNAPKGLYIAVNDPYEKDQAKTSKSLGCTQIWIREWPGWSNSTRLVADWTGRPATYEQYNEQALLLVQWYNTELLWESNVHHVLNFFRRKNALSWLSRTPSFGDKNIRGRSRGYGMHVNEKLKSDLLLLADKWLKDSSMSGAPNWKGIRSIPFIKEIMSFHSKGNFDRVSSFLLFLAQNEEYHHLYKPVSRKSEKKDIFDERIRL